MSAVRPTRLAGSAMALTLGAAVLLPAPLGAGLRPVGSADPAAWIEELEPGPPGWVSTVDDRLGIRMPALEDTDRRRLARTLVLEAELARVDPLLVLALIEVESAYDPAARSARGALGLMQLREPTLRREVERAGLHFADAHDPETNLRAGIRYLRRLLDAFGREDVALMAYNAGPNRILGYLRAGEVPARFQVYPRKVRAEIRRLRRHLASVQLAAAVSAPSR